MYTLEDLSKYENIEHNYTIKFTIPGTEIVESEDFYLVPTPLNLQETTFLIDAWKTRYSFIAQAFVKEVQGYVVGGVPTIDLAKIAFEDYVNKKGQPLTLKQILIYNTSGVTMWIKVDSYLYKMQGKPTTFPKLVELKVKDFYPRNLKNYFTTACNRLLR